MAWYYNDKLIEIKSNDLTPLNNQFAKSEYCCAKFSGAANGYAKTDNQVFYRGGLIKNADASSFTVLDHPADTEDAKDKRSFLSAGKEIKISNHPILMSLFITGKLFQHFLLLSLKELKRLQKILRKFNSP